MEAGKGSEKRRWEKEVERERLFRLFARRADKRSAGVYNFKPHEAIKSPVDLSKQPLMSNKMRTILARLISVLVNKFYCHHSQFLAFPSRPSTG